jgi:hypothetical protein
MTAQKDKTIMILVIAIMLIVIGMFVQKSYDIFAVTGGESLTRTVPNTVNPGEQFSVTYQTSGAPADKWFVAWEESITGGCTPSTYKDFMASERRQINYCIIHRSIKRFMYIQWFL